MGKRSRRKNRNRKVLGKKLGNLGKGKISGFHPDNLVVDETLDRFDRLFGITPEATERMRKRLKELAIHESASPVSNHAQGLAQDIVVVQKKGASVDAQWAYDQWRKARNYDEAKRLAYEEHLKKGALSKEEVERQFKSWSQIDAETPDPEAEELSRVCIWCGITCESIEALEAHEETCE